MDNNRLDRINAALASIGGKLAERDDLKEQLDSVLKRIEDIGGLENAEAAAAQIQELIEALDIVEGVTL